MKEANARIPVPVQLVLGAALAVGVVAVSVVLGLLHVTVSNFGWVMVFFTIWVAMYAVMKLRMFAFGVALILVFYTLYFILAARDFRLWW